MAIQPMHLRFSIHFRSPGMREPNLMKRSDALLWMLIILVAGAVIWLASTGRLQLMIDSLVDGFWSFYEGILRTLRR
jgi:hypothetical protein